MFFKRKSFSGQFSIDLNNFATSAKRIAEFCEHISSLKSSKGQPQVNLELLNQSLYLVAGNSYYRGIILVAENVSEANKEMTFAFDATRLSELRKIGNEYSGKTTLVVSGDLVTIGGIELIRNGKAQSMKTLLQPAYPITITFDRKEVLAKILECKQSQHIQMSYSHKSQTMRFSEVDAKQLPITSFEVSVQSDCEKNISNNTSMESLLCGLSCLQSNVVSLEFQRPALGKIVLAINKFAEVTDSPLGQFQYFCTPVYKEESNGDVWDVVAWAAV